MLITRRASLAVVLAAALAVACVSAQAIEKANKGIASRVLKGMHQDLKRLYYDPKLRGIDMDAHYAEAVAEIERSTSDQQRYRALSRFMKQLDDSHTYFAGFTPIWISDYGFGLRFYGNTPFVSAVNSWSSADSLGLRRGDEILRFAGHVLTRDNYETLAIDFLAQDPIPQLELEVRAPDRSLSKLTLLADTAALRRMKGQEFRKLFAGRRDSAELAMRHRATGLRDRVFYWRPPSFEDADIGLGKMVRTANKHEALILDMRGNPGGPIQHLKEVMAYFIDKQTDIGTLHMRWDREVYRAKPKGDRFTGKLLVLVDSETASAAEVLARSLQLGGAIIVGDRTAGAVMASMQFGWASITVSDFVLHNGERLEKKGVTPDVVLIPTATEIAAGHDPVLAYALAQNGINLTGAQAAKLLSDVR